MKEPMEAAFNVRDLTTSDLEDIRSRLPALLAAHGLQASSVAIALARPADLYFLATDAPIEEMIDVIIASGSSLVFVGHEDFDPAELLEDDASVSEIDPAVARILEAAIRQQGQLRRVTLTWAVNGPLCSWHANATQKNRGNR